MKKIAAYIRVSTEEQARIQDGSLVSQKNRIIEYVEHQNKIRPGFGLLVDFYVDEGKSAKAIKGRPEFQRLLQDVQSGKVDLIIATELSRLSRSIRDFCEVWDLLKKYNASFITLRESFDTTTASGEMMVFNLINFAQYERKQTGERIQANWQSRAKRGLFNGGTIPFGYDRNPKNKGELLVNEPEAEQVRAIFNLFLEKESLRKTAVALTEKGIFQKRYTNKHGIEKGGKPFTIGALNTLLTNHAYIAEREAIIEGKAQMIKAVWPAIISREIFDQVQARLKLNHNRYKPDDWKTYPFPLTELVACGECGKHMGGKSGTGRIQKHFYYSHSQPKDPTKRISEISCQVKSVRAPRLEELILKCMRSVLNDPAIIEKWVAIYKAQALKDQPEVLSEAKRLESEINSVARKISNLVGRISELPSDVPADSFYDQIKQMTAKKQQLVLAKETLAAKVRGLNDKDISEQGLIDRLRIAVERLESLPKEEQRPVLKIIHSIEIRPMKLKIGFFAPKKSESTPAPESETKKATGTDGLTLNLNLKSELASVIPFDPSRRAGSSTVGSGASGRT